MKNIQQRKNRKIDSILDSKHIITFVFFLLTTTVSYSQKIDSILIGNGGGFTGQITVYNLSKNSIKKGKGVTSIVYSNTSKLKSKDSKKICSEAKKVFNTSDGFSHPYNTYKFIEIYSNGKVIKYTWGDPNFTVPENIESLYKHITTLISSLNLNQK